MGRLLEYSNAESWVQHSPKRFKFDDFFPEPEILYMETEPKGLTENSGESNQDSDNEVHQISSDVAKDSQKDRNQNPPNLTEGASNRRPSSSNRSDGSRSSSISEQQFHAGMILPDMKDLAPESGGQNP
ncbi:hypothetical protein GUITHDRAFT_133093 [Guillardia theta CCMP2712]|uniref:Uncharacterized protein n=1 Tax=Guillardia theta (strain CCMP2712) TaxID=905079 RepID=L1JYG3_GUITC|nr:hypothetical protein GUITHDRAFT_133093 [Guillardia theta CCMP2712]EKX53364.1 hypothetical protein GUITHDRAFT_133093 [Guillardia theta CCMP2712]|eukprot:XP_005840344.1 hypothetical protein GUITHDRAFT_133093 [Guillardia theta CCMP2712]